MKINLEIFFVKSPGTGIAVTDVSKYFRALCSSSLNLDSAHFI